MSARRRIFNTGAVWGCGRATARLFSWKRWYLAIVDLHMNGLESVKDEIGL